MPSTEARTRHETPLSRDDIEALIADGAHIFIYNDTVIKADAWLQSHPGGDVAIKHMVGRDATDEYNALHSADTLQQLSRYRIGRICGSWTNFKPPIQGGHFRSAEEIAADSPDESWLSPTPSAVDDTSSGFGSASVSPIFDTLDNCSLRHSKNAARQLDDPASSSASSVSSFDIDQNYDGSKQGQNLTEKQLQDAVEDDLRKYPSLDPATQGDIVQQYRALKQKLQDQGLFNCNYAAYGLEIFRYTLLFSTFLFTLHWGWYCTSAISLGIFWHQLVFTAHDAGHMGITHDFQIDTCIGILIADFLGGLSIGWWKRSHNVHHIVTNSPEHDPDIEHLPFFAISSAFFQSLRSTYYNRVMTYDSFARFTVRFQNFSYYPVMLLGRFNLYVLSWEHLYFGRGPRKGAARWHRWLEIAGQVFFWIWYGYAVVYRSIPTAGSRIAFVLISNMVTMPLHVQITLSHFAMSTADLGVAESFPQRMLRTTMDVDCPQWLDFVHGGLQFQAIHHLYPRMPRHNLRKAQKLVQDFSLASGVPYARYGFVDGNKQVLGKLGEVAQQAALLAACQKRLMEHSGHGH